MALTQPIDVHDFLIRGYAKSSLQSHVADFLGRRLRELEYEPLPSDHCEAGPRFRGLLEKNASVSRLLSATWASILDADLLDLAQHYRCGAERSAITAIKCSSGYGLDWHNHLSTGSTATLLVYLFDNADMGSGGDLVVGSLASDFRTCTPIKRFGIQHGDVVLIGDGSHPLLQHKAERWDGAGWRRLVSFAFNSSDW